MHMTCRKSEGGCGFEFCWLCLGPWAPHGSRYYECPKYEQMGRDGTLTGAAARAYQAQHASSELKKQQADYADHVRRHRFMLDSAGHCDTRIDDLRTRQLWIEQRLVENQMVVTTRE